MAASIPSQSARGKLAPKVRTDLTPPATISKIKAMVSQRGDNVRMKRPLSITIIGVLILCQGLVFTAVAGVTLPLISAIMFRWLPPGYVAELPNYTQRELLFVGAALVIGVCCLVSGVGVLRLRSWAWLMAMIVQGINLSSELVNYLRGHPVYFNMLVSVIIVLYLNQRDIQASMNAADYRRDPSSRITVEPDQATPEAQQKVIRTR